MALSPELSFYWYCKSAEQGNILAQNEIERCYRNGLGVIKDPVRAAMWCRKAAEQGSSNAQSNMAAYYFNGEGVTRDYVEGYAYLNLAGVTDEDARKKLSKIEETLSREQVSAGQKRAKELQKEIEAKIATDIDKGILFRKVGN